jgi:hypothetical protein
MSSQAALKIAFNGEIHRSRVDLNVFHLSDLLRLVAQTFHLDAGSFVIQYTDAEGDRLNVGSDAEYAEACRVFLSSNDAVKSLKFVAVPRHQAAFQEKVADPIVTSIENLIHALTATLEKVKSESWASGAQVHESIDAVRHSIQELPYEQVSKETTAGAKTAAEGFSSFAQGLVGQIKQLVPEKKDAAAPAAKPEAEQKVPAQVQVVPPPAPVATPVAPVAVPAPAATPVAPVAVTEAHVATGVPVAFSESELKWADELSLVHNIFPNVSSARVIDMLEQCGGNVNVVLNTLMEDA